MRERPVSTCAAMVLALALSAVSAAPAQEVMWGGTTERNMVGDATDVPTSWDVETGENILWSHHR